MSYLRLAVNLAVLSLLLAACSDPTFEEAPLEGIWKLDPGLSVYEAGEPPLSAWYQIASQAEFIEIDRVWVDSRGETHFAAYAGPCDASKLAISDDSSRQIAIECVDRWTLDTATYADGNRMRYTRRQVSDDGMTLVIAQEGVWDTGGTFRNFEVYRRFR